MTFLSSSRSLLPDSTINILSPILMLTVLTVQSPGPTWSRLMLAAFDFAAYSNAIHRLESGDRLLLYTDGIVEASNASGDALGQDALWSLLRKTVRLSSSEAADSIMSSVRQWSAKQDDDLNVLVCDYIGDGPISTGGVQLDT